ncbi:MAG: hypothetical protein L0Z62_11685 [Gemmataceae bacterium]|nr:hypothetical protein [Gemmataceae bacterium]
MPTVQIQAQLSSEELLKAVQQLDLPDLEQFLAQVLTLWAQRQRPPLSAAEKKLLRKINEGLPEGLSRRFSELRAKREEETLTPDEHKELLRLIDEVERRQAERVAAMVELAGRRSVSLEKLMTDLGIAPPTDE